MTSARDLMRYETLKLVLKYGIIYVLSIMYVMEYTGIYNFLIKLVIGNHILNMNRNATNTSKCIDTITIIKR